MNIKRRILYFIPAILWMGVIFYFSSQSADVSSLNNNFVVNILKGLGLQFKGAAGEDLANHLIRKAAHVTEYFILFLLCYRGFFKGGFKMPILPSALVSIFYSMTDEFHQLFIPGRGGSMRDVLIDSMGVGIGLVIVLYRDFRDRHPL